VSEELAAARRILVITKFRYLGDTIVATPFLRRLKEALPQAEISLLSGPAMPTLLRGCPWLEEIIPFDPKGPRRLPRNLQLIRALKARQFDVVFLLNRSLHSSLIARAAGIPVRIGFDTEHRGPLLTTRVRYDWERPDRDCALDLLRAAGRPAEPALPELWVDSEEREEADAMLRQRGIEPDRFLIGMQPGAHDPEVREWGASRFAEAADRLMAERGAAVALLGSAEERAVAERVAAEMRTKPVVFAGETSLRQAMAVISRCGLWIGNDGGLLHAAVALCPATVGIFGPTKAKRWGCDTPHHRTVAHFPEHGEADAAAIRRCLDSIEPDEVVAAASGAIASLRTEGECEVEA